MDLALDVGNLGKVFKQRRYKNELGLGPMQMAVGASWTGDERTVRETGDSPAGELPPSHCPQGGQPSPLGTRERQGPHWGEQPWALGDWG